jgi:hypothetical protein
MLGLDLQDSKSPFRAPLIMFFLAGVLLYIIIQTMSMTIDPESREMG